MNPIEKIYHRKEFTTLSLFINENDMVVARKKFYRNKLGDLEDKVIQSSNFD